MNNFLAMRGNTELSEEQFKAHVAQAMRLENVGVLLGAGASCCAGGNTMDKTWENFCAKENSTKIWLQDESFISNPDKKINIEKLIDTLEIACLEWKRQNSKKLNQLLKSKSAIYRHIIKAALLQDDLWVNPDSEESSEKLKNHKRMLAKLVSNRQPGQASPWIFTTNYDLAIEWSAEALELNIINGFSGTHCRRFSPNSFDLGYRNIRTRGEAQFGAYNVYLAKLHGSLTWELGSDGNVLEWQSIIQKEKINKFLSNENEKVPPGIIIYPGAAKFIEATGFLYGEMIRRFSEYLSRSNTCLIVNGYGFNDKHINKLIAGALQNPTLQLIVYYTKQRVEPSGEAESFSPALKRLLEYNLPQLTVCLGNPRAHFEEFVEDLPEPALVDEQAEKARELIKFLYRLDESKKKSSLSEEETTK